MTLTSKEIEARLSRKPHPKAIKVRDGRPYVPISSIEKQLDMLFGVFGWQTSELKTIVVINEVCGSLELQVKNPDTGEWITRHGMAAVQVQMTKDSSVLDAGSKIKNAMEKMFPKLKSDCISNAAQGLGKLFGRDLARKEEDQEPFSDMEKQYLEGFKQITKGLTSIEEIQEKFRALPEALRGQFDFLETLKERVEEAKSKALPR